ncbi:hypothetical protein [Bradyrhizobium arachidis]|uniref:Uncharacterized protein n=1 Tax=Bradyrhizobium arachidis TaxID=858423 RepID=A0AAE7NNX6_9BRAD|nr:hypothetical protein [Bradyrhizobium arachidis]QOZ65914.1 hypothetical protein WN72_05400 [Bradyrhizobium arachidis]
MLVELIGYGVARIVLPFLSLGRVYVEAFSATPEPLRWPDYRRDATGRIELRQAAAAWIGFGMCLLMLLAIIAMFHGTLFWARLEYRQMVA